MAKRQGVVFSRNLQLARPCRWTLPRRTPLSIMKCNVLIKMDHSKRFGALTNKCLTNIMQLDGRNGPDRAGVDRPVWSCDSAKATRHKSTQSSCSDTQQATRSKQHGPAHPTRNTATTRHGLSNPTRNAQQLNTDCNPTCDRTTTQQHGPHQHGPHHHLILVDTDFPQIRARRGTGIL